MNTTGTQEPPAERLGIVFLHHKVDEVTLNHLQSFQKWNPQATIVTMSAEDAFPGGYSIQDFPDHLERWKKHTQSGDLKARSADLLLYAWYENRRESCDRWLIVEWDAYCGMSAEEFIAPVSEFDISAPVVRWLNRDPEWYWFRTVRSLPARLQQFAVGTMPFCFISVRDSVLSSICKAVPWEHLGTCNGELRFGTLAYACGFIPVCNPHASWNITWQPHPETMSVQTGMWHPVKWKVPVAQEGNR